MLLYEILLSDISGSEISNSINRDNSDVFDGPQKILEQEKMNI